MKEYYITFRSITYAQRGEAVLQAGGIRCRMTRTPRWMEERGCGYCIGLAKGVQEAAELLRQAGVGYSRIYAKTPGGGWEALTL